MTFAKVWGSGLADGQPATGAALTQLDTNVSRSLDGFAGGKYQPTAVLNIAGEGLQVGDPGDDPLFSVAASKWMAAASDFSFGSSISTFVLSQICSIDEGWLFAVGSGNDKIAQSKNDGQTWTDISANIASPQTIPLLCCAARYDGVGPASAIIAAGNSVKLYYSTDQGATWSNVTLPGSPTNIHKAHYDPINGLFIVIGKTGAAPYIATAPVATPGTWTQRTVPAAITGVVDGVSISQSYLGRLVVSWNSQTKVAYSDDGTTWTASTSSLTSGNYYVQFGDGVFIALDKASTSNAYTSVDGDTWTSSGVTKPSSGSIAITGFAALNGLFVVAGTAGGTASGRVYYSVDKCLTWLYVINGGTGALVPVASYTQALQGRIHMGYTDGTNSANARSRRIGMTGGV